MIGLTPRERAVLLLLGLGMDTPQVADEMGLTDRQVRRAVENAMRKLGVHRRAEAVAIVAGYPKEEP